MLSRGGRAPCLPPCSRRQPARPGGKEGSSPRRRRRRGVCGTGREMGMPRAFRFLPASRPVTFYNHGRPPPAPPPTSFPSPLLASRRLSRSAPALASACLPACLPAALGVPPPFRPPFNRSQLVIGDAKALAFHPLLLFFFSSPTEARAIGKLSSGRLLGGKDQRSWHLAGLRSWRNALLMTIWSEMMGHLSSIARCGLSLRDRDACVVS